MEARIVESRTLSEIEAKSELNKTMLRLRNRYGFAPAKGISSEEMRKRCSELVDAANHAIETYVCATGKAPDRMRNLENFKASKDFPRKKYEGLEAFSNVSNNQLKRAPLYTVEAIGNLLNFNADYLLKAAHEERVKAMSPAEWRRKEYEYVEKSDYNLRDLYDDLMKRLDAPEDYITVEQYREERRKWRKCRYYACDNYYPIEKTHMESAAFKRSGLEFRRTDTKYCSAECRKSQENAIVRLRKTGTRLPAHSYEYVLDDAVENRAEKEVATDAENINKIAD